MKKAISLLLICLLMAAPCALADLQRGDNGEDVQVMQEYLIDTGFLSDKADGIFGRNTENAVKAYQESLGLEPTGVATPELLDSLRDDWLEAVYGLSTTACSIWYDGIDERFVHYCDHHDGMSEAAAALTTPEEAAQLWEDEVNRLYGLWLEASPEENQPAVTASRTMFFSALGHETAVWTSLSSDGAYAAENRIVRLQEKCVELCGIIDALNG